MIDRLKQKCGNGVDERGVSPVIGTVLMVAVTVLLAGVIVAFVMGLPSSLGNAPVQAAVDVEMEDTNGDDVKDVKVTLKSENDPDTELRVEIKNSGDGPDKTLTVSDVGQTETYTAGSSGDSVDVTVVAVNGDRETVVAEESGTL